MIVVGFVLGLVVGMGVMATAFGAQTRQRYASPFLHEGEWGWPQVQGMGDQSRVLWHLQTVDGREVAQVLPHVHEPLVCNIGPGLAHMDECICGATRSGVYGEWFLPRT